MFIRNKFDLPSAQIMGNINILVISEIKFIGNKAKGRISKRVFQESKARQNFRKTNICTGFYMERNTGLK